MTDRVKEPGCTTCGKNAYDHMWKAAGHRFVCKCGSIDQKTINYDPIWKDGDVICIQCGAYIRGYDAG